MDGPRAHRYSESAINLDLTMAPGRSAYDTWHPTGRPGVLFGARERRQPQFRRARTGHHDTRGEQASGADGIAGRLVAREPHDAPDEPDAGGRALSGARPAHPGRDRRHGA